MIILQDSGESRDKVHDYTRTTIYQVTCNMLVDITVHNGLGSYTKYQ